MLENIQIAKPCPADWNSMTGDERVRFCQGCKLHVYNLSAMTRRDAEALVTKTEGKVCVRLYQRADGTVITRDCPVGLAAIRKRIATLAASVFAVLACGLSAFATPNEPEGRRGGAGADAAANTTSQTTASTTAPTTTRTNAVVPPRTHVLMGRTCVVMGEPTVPPKKPDTNTKKPGER